MMNIEQNILEESSPTQRLRAALGLSVITLTLCGFVYSAVTTGIGQILFPEQANGSMIEQNGKIVGSRLVAQPFVQDRYFSSRPSAAKYDPMTMAGSNLARSNPELLAQIQQRVSHIAEREHVAVEQIPSDMVTSSGSGIDPHISVQAATIQVKRVAKARHLSEQEVRELINQYTQKPTLGLLGQARVNVFELNLALDQIQS